MTKKKKIQLKINKELRGYKAGTVISIVPDMYWRKRIQDAKIDGCVEIIKSNKGVK